MTDECDLRSETIAINITLAGDAPSLIIKDEQAVKVYENSLFQSRIIDSTNQFALPVAKIDKIDLQGRVEIKFSKKMYTEFLSELSSGRRELKSVDECWENASSEYEFW